MEQVKFNTITNPRPWYLSADALLIKQAREEFDFLSKYGYNKCMKKYHKQQENNDEHYKTLKRMRVPRR